MTLSKVYVSIMHQAVYMNPKESPWEFEVLVDREIVPVFQKLFEQLNYVEGINFWRAHIPIKPYHMDKNNDQYDLKKKKVYKM